MDEQANRRCLLAFAAVALTAALLVGAFNWLVDPYRLFGAPLTDGFNLRKPVVGKNTRMIKAWEVVKLRPAAIILGTSRAEVGLDPNHPGWRAQPVYNLALPAARIYEAYRYLQHADAQRPLQQVVLALDFSMFNGAVPSQPGFDELRLDLAGESWHSLGRVHDLLTMLFSFDGLKSSIETIQRQRDAFVSYLPSGERHPTEKWEEIREGGGHRAAFLRDADYDMRAADGWALFSFAYPEQFRYETTFGPLRDLLRYCRARGIELHATISPLHAHKLLEIRQVGLWGQYDSWKRSLVYMVQEANSGPGDKPITLWDFSGLHAFATEPLPALADAQTRMRWYWEGSHYQRQVGDAMLDKIFGVDSAHIEPPAGFGIQLSSGNIESHLAAVRTDLERYAAAHEDQVRALAELFAHSAKFRAQVLAVRAKHVRNQ
jgi:hypothetical protein